MQGTTHKGAWHCRFELTSVDNGRVPNPLVSCQTKFRGRQMVTIPMFNCRNVLLGRFPPTKDHSRLLNSCIVLMSDIFVSPMQQDSSNRFRSRWQLTFTKHIWPSLDRRWAANTVSPHRAPKPQRPDPDLGGSPVPTVSAGKCVNKKRVISPANPMGNIDKYEYMISFKKNKYCMLKKRKWCEKSSVGCIVLLLSLFWWFLIYPFLGKDDDLRTTSLILPQES